MALAPPRCQRGSLASWLELSTKCTFPASNSVNKARLCRAAGQEPGFEQPPELRIALTSQAFFQWELEDVTIRPNRSCLAALVNTIDVSTATPTFHCFGLPGLT